MRRAAKVDANHAAIVRRFREIGATVQDLSAVGKGCPDLLVGYHGVNVLVEIKDGEKVPSARKLTADQVTWHAKWSGQVDVCSSVEDAQNLVIRLATGRAA